MARADARHSFGRGDQTIFNFVSQSVDEQLENKMTLWRYVQLRVFPLGNEHGMMQGTFLTETNTESMTSLLLTDFKARDSALSVEHSALSAYFEAFLISYTVKNAEILHEMCKYLNSHIGSSTNHSSLNADQLLQFPSLPQSHRQSKVESLQYSGHLNAEASLHADDSEVFSVRQFSSNA